LAGVVTQEHRVLAERRSLTLDTRLASGPSAYADPTSLARALSNLLSNAVRLAPSGSTITVAVGSRSGWAWVAVRDEGPGIPDDERTRVFDRFHRGSADRTPGSGLGLAIARQVAESHQGRLVLAERSGPGSTFVLWLPERAVGGPPERTGLPPTTDPLTLPSGSPAAAR
jgi:signal transduction histidine kinase